MYEAFYGLKEKPFSILPDPSFMYWASAHSKAFAMLEYGIAGNPGITVITGEVGAGKTTLIRYLLNQLPDDITVGVLSHMQPGQGSLLEWLLMSLDAECDSASTYVARFRQLQEFLIRQYAQGRRTVLIIDEAQNLDVKTLEELRMMSNINADKHNLLQIVLTGQPELRQRLCSPELVQFAQRVTSDFHLGLLRPEEVPSYINFRLAIAGADQPLFSAGACRLINQATHGTPRLINALCDMCLTYGFAEGAECVTEEIVAEVLEDKRRHGALARAAS